MPERGAEDWRVLRALCLYRLVLAPALAAVFFGGVAPDFLGLRLPGLFQAMTYAWFAAGSLLGPLWSYGYALQVLIAPARRRGGREVQSRFARPGIR